jgi:uncharacterized phage protein gp47/JayE
VPIITRSEAELLEKSRKDLRRLLPSITNTAEGSTIGALLEIAAGEHADINQRIDALQRNLFISTASGTAIDRLGELFGLTRGRPLRAFDTGRNVRFRIDPATGEYASTFVSNRIPNNVIDEHPDTLSPTGFTIREGTTLSTAGGVTYTTTQSLTISGAAFDGYTNVLATGVGPSFNVSLGELRKHDLKTFQPELAAVADFILVENRMPISNGVFTETDDDLRLRITEAIFTTQAANQTAIVAAVLSVPGVRNAVYLPFSSGMHSFTVVIESTDPLVSDGLVAAAQQALNSVTAAGNRGMASRPIYNGIEAKVGLRFRPDADRARIRQLARRASVDYINEIALGDSFILNELIQRIMDVDDKILDTHFQRFSTGIYNPSTRTFTESQDLMPPTNLTQNSVLESFFSSDRLFTVCDQT